MIEETAIRAHCYMPYLAALQSSLPFHQQKPSWLNFHPIIRRSYPGQKTKKAQSDVEDISKNEQKGLDGIVVRFNRDHMTGRIDVCLQQSLCTK